MPDPTNGIRARVMDLSRSKVTLRKYCWSATVSLYSRGQLLEHAIQGVISNAIKTFSFYYWTPIIFRITLQKHMTVKQ